MNHLRPFIFGVLVGLLSCSAISAAEDDIPGTVRSTVGITRKETVIEALLPAEGKLDDPRLRVLIVGSLDGSAEAKSAVLDALRWFYMSDDAATLRKQLTLAAIPCVNPDGLAAKTGPANGSGGNSTIGYPPAKGFYDSPTDPEAAYLWRWIGMYGQDHVIEVRRGNDSPPAASNASGLVAALAKAPACDVGTVPGTTLMISADENEHQLINTLRTLANAEPKRSPCHAELLRRQKRQPADVAQELAKVYGHNLDQVAYIPAMAVIGRLRLMEITGERSQRPDIDKLLAPYFRGEKNTTPKAGNEQSGHLVFAEMARLTSGDEQKRYVNLCRVAADQIFDESGKPLPLMPFHLEMSDAVFMAGPILCATGKLTGERKYFDAAAQHLAGMRKLCLRSDGVYRHSPLDESAWGRGNGFPALGLSLCLSDFPEDHPARDELLTEFRAHMAALKRHQDASGCWRQVIDKPASYREFTSTCMIGFAMLRGIDRGWLPREEYAEPVRRAWEAIKLRVGPEGSLVDVCTGTGKMKSLREYYDRPAILGKDDRGGAMGLLFAVEMLEHGAGL